MQRQKRQRRGGLIYRILNLVNGKCYVGQTTRGLKRRRREHLSDFERGKVTPLYKAFKKYGVESFEWIVLCWCSTGAELDVKEREYIEAFDSRRNGYNISNGGNSHIITDETRRRMSEAKKGVPKSEETKRRMSEARSGSKHWLYGKTTPDTTRAKISASLKGNRNPMSNPLNRAKQKAATRKFVGSGNPMYGRHLSDEERRACGDASRGIPKTNDHRMKIREALLRYHREHPVAHAGKNNPRFGVTLSIEQRGRISNSLKRRADAKVH